MASKPCHFLFMHLPHRYHLTTGVTKGCAADAAASSPRGAACTAQSESGGCIHRGSSLKDGIHVNTHAHHTPTPHTTLSCRQAQTQTHSDIQTYTHTYERADGCTNGTERLFSARSATRCGRAVGIATILDTNIYTHTHTLVQTVALPHAELREVAWLVARPQSLGALTLHTLSFLLLPKKTKAGSTGETKGHPGGRIFRYRENQEKGACRQGRVAGGRDR